MDTSVLEQLSSWDEKSYATSYVNLNKPVTRFERLEEISIKSEEDAIEVLRSGEGGERRARATAYLVSTWKRIDGERVKKEVRIERQKWRRDATLRRWGHGAKSGDIKDAKMLGKMSC